MEPSLSFLRWPSTLLSLNLVQSPNESMVVLNAELQVVSATQRFYDTFQVLPSETEQCRIFDLGNRQWNIPRLQSLLEGLLPHNTQIQDFEVKGDFEHIGSKTMLLNASKMPLLEGKQLILISIEDISVEDDHLA